MYISPETFMDPEPCNAGLGVVEVLVGSEHALKYLGKRHTSGMEGGKRFPSEILEVRSENAVFEDAGDLESIECY